MTKNMTRPMNAASPVAHQSIKVCQYYFSDKSELLTLYLRPILDGAE